MLRSSKRYQKQTRDALRKQNSQSRYQSAMNNLNAVAAEGRAKKAAEEEAERTKAHALFLERHPEERVAEMQQEDPPTSAFVNELERLAQLHQSGALTDDEFARAKWKLLS